MNSVLICAGAIYAAGFALSLLAAFDCLGLKHYSRNPYAPDPLPNQWVTVGVMHYDRDFNGLFLGERRDEYFVCLHLPIYGLRYQINMDREEWSQDCVYIGFARGMRKFSIPVPAVGPEL